MRPDSIYDWEHPREEDFDARRYEAAVQEARPLLAGAGQRIDTLYLAVVPDAILEWSSGERSTFPKGLHVVEVEAFRIGA